MPRAALIFSLIAAGLSASEQVRPLQVRWAEALGSPASPYFAGAPPSELVESFETPDFKAQLFRQRTDKATWQRILVMKPKGLDGRTAGVVVPFYDPDRMCGYDLKSKQRLDPERNTAFFALHLVRQGYVVAAVEAYPFNLLTPEEQKASKGGMGVWRDAAAKLARDRFYFDELYEWFISVTQETLAKVADWFDRWVIAGLLVRGTHGTTELFGRALRLVQTGSLQTYAFLFAAGVVLVLAWQLLQTHAH